MKKHYIAMSGLEGYLPDTCQSFSRLQDAIDEFITSQQSKSLDCNQDTAIR